MITFLLFVFKVNQIIKFNNQGNFKNVKIIFDDAVTNNNDTLDVNEFTSVFTGIKFRINVKRLNSDTITKVSYEKWP